MRPPVPASFKSFAFQLRWAPDPPDEVHRRTLYLFLQRNMVFPNLPVFDRPDPNVTCVRRERSNTPLQALSLLNDPESVESAQGLAGRTFRERSGSIDALGRICLNRDFGETEREILVSLTGDLESRYRNAPETAKAVAADSLLPGVDRAKVAAWIGVCRVILNTDEFMTRQ